MIKRYRLIFSGRVQGVGFRWRTWQYARQHQLVGWIQNQADGTVMLELEGAEEELFKFKQWLKIILVIPLLPRSKTRRLNQEAIKNLLFVINYGGNNFFKRCSGAG